MELTLLELGITIAVAAGFGYIAKLLQQPTILGYILTGFLLTFFAIDHQTQEVMELFSKLGIAFLLFMVGLELKLTEIKEVGPVAFMTGIGQVLFTAIFGGILVYFVFGMSLMEASYIGIALAFSSTIIILKLLGEKGDLNSLYGRISIGFLIVQDIVAIIALILLNSLSVSTGTEGNVVFKVLEVLIVGGILVFTAILFGRLIGLALTPVGKATEILLLGMVGWALLFASYAEHLGLTLEVGAFLAGMGLAASPLSAEFAAKMKPLRDFFIIIFFITLGSTLSLSGVSSSIVPILVLSLFVLFGNPLILLVIMGWMGYHRRISFLSGLTVSQISEFSLILAATGVALGQIRPDILPLLTGVAVITMVISSFFIANGDIIYNRFSSQLKIFQRSEIRANKLKRGKKPEVLVFGGHRMGAAILYSLREARVPMQVIDYDPAMVRSLAANGYSVLYGDLSDPELIETVDLSKVKVVISTVPLLEDNLFLLSQLSYTADKIFTIIRASSDNHVAELKENGADVVLIPEEVAGAHVVDLLIDHEILEKKAKKA